MRIKYAELLEAHAIKKEIAKLYSLCNIAGKTIKKSKDGKTIQKMVFDRSAISP
jgi:hypothetical protein